MPTASSVYSIGHKLQGQTCMYRVVFSNYAPSTICAELATWVSFGVRRTVDNHSTPEVTFGFLCDEHISEEAKCSSCPHIEGE